MATKFIQRAIKRPGALRKKAGVKGEQTISESKLDAMAATARRKGDTRTLQQIAFARTLRGFHK
jgi:hypothetical protein